MCTISLDRDVRKLCQSLLSSTTTLRAPTCRKIGSLNQVVKCYENRRLGSRPQHLEAPVTHRQLTKNDNIWRHCQDRTCQQYDFCPPHPRPRLFSPNSLRSASFSLLRSFVLLLFIQVSSHLLVFHQCLPRLASIWQACMYNVELT